MRQSQASRTAQLVAAGLLLLTHDPALRQLVPADAARFGREFLSESGWGVAGYERRCASPAFRRIVFAVSDWLVPGLLVHYALRKRFIEDEARRSIARGASQVVVLGSGFDTLALRLCGEFPECGFVEIDHPATQSVKLRALSRLRWPGAPNLAFVAADFAGGFEQALLASPAYEPSRDTVLVAEGLLMYLVPREVSRIFEFAGAEGGRAPTLVFTYLEPQPGNRVGFRAENRLVAWWLRRRSEPFRWGAGAEELRAMLSSSGFDVIVPGVTAKELRRRYLSGEAQAKRADGDLICVAQKSAADFSQRPRSVKASG